MVTPGYSFLAYGGMGAYAAGTLKLSEPTTVYLTVGGMGTSNLDNPNTTVYRGGGYNGGGGVVNDGNGGGGGGATDLRIASNNLNNRVLVAAGGGGASWGASNPGGAGGGAGNGENGYMTQNAVNGTVGFWGYGSSTVGGGATQTRGGYIIPHSTSHSALNINDNVTPPQGSTLGVSVTQPSVGGWGYGGNGAGSHWAGGGGGAGWYGGGGGYVHTGGGGSSYAWTEATKNNAPSSYAFKTSGKYYLTDTLLLAGNDSQLNGNNGAHRNPGASGYGTTGRKCWG